MLHNTRGSLAFNVHVKKLADKKKKKNNDVRFSMQVGESIVTPHSANRSENIIMQVGQSALITRCVWTALETSIGCVWSRDQCVARERKERERRENLKPQKLEPTMTNLAKKFLRTQMTVETRYLYTTVLCEEFKYRIPMSS